MKNIKITEQNKDMYTKLYNAKRYDSNDSIITTISLGLVMMVFGLGSIPFFDYLSQTLLLISNSDALSLCIFGYAACGSLIAWSIPIMYHCSKIRRFKKEYPEIDIKIKESELEKALENYERLSKIPKDIEIKKEEHLTNFDDEFRNMTNQEKLDFLQQEIEFWERLSEDEKFIESLSELEKENIQKTIGTIK